jgi:hypothetical protein
LVSGSVGRAIPSLAPSVRQSVADTHSPIGSGLDPSVPSVFAIRRIVYPAATIAASNGLLAVQNTSFTVRADPNGHLLGSVHDDLLGRIELVEAAMMGFPKYDQRAAGTNTSFMQALSQNVLGRAIDPLGGGSGDTALTQNVDRRALAAVILASQEEEQDLVQDAYRQHPRRASHNARSSFWPGRLQQDLTDDGLVTAFIAADEFGQRS